MQFERAQPIEEFVKTVQKRNYEYEFQYLRQNTETAQHEKYLVKDVQVQKLNRYSNILPFSHSIVKPEVQSPNKLIMSKDKFYINANYIRGINNVEKQYIATQGPIPESIIDFWHMVWTNNVQVVIMLCNFFDKGRVQCEKYWPKTGQKAQFGPYEVQSISQEEILKSIFQHKIIIKTQVEYREIIHYQWTNWNDFGVVGNDELRILDMLADISNKAGMQNKRPVIHCSAGVGRTGTFLAICHIKQLLINNKAKISIFSIVRRLREQRALMIQTPEQYQMLYRYTLWLIQNLKYI
ncbi:unnamed protein product (macronuclear) [Paramecium tetraurelia]|uniref:Protein tyrosine phosphatase n=1 Tax=Paramecium tetraurelia TaxID=5888 RepID=A0CUN5_PARTE|nr:uncharacterized protein GSPATT00010702001 [Paramecium tetraurelia]CAK74502.1 unnamed protein product [Paramecium tetraurelia]|eukprot:XP_001441899.1 hypothetical protein (macronuclear) [Paramecium tetraurelia strain d4-2]